MLTVRSKVVRVSCQSHRCGAANHSDSWRHLAPRKTVAGGFLKRANAFRKRGGSCFNGLRLFDFRNKRGADDRGVGQAAKNRNMSGKRNPEADRDGKFRCAAGTPQKRREIVGQGILRAGDSSPRNPVDTTGGTGRDFFEALVRGSRRAEKNRIEMVSGEDAAILFPFVRRP